MKCAQYVDQKLKEMMDSGGTCATVDKRTEETEYGLYAEMSKIPLKRFYVTARLKY